MSDIPNSKAATDFEIVGDAHIEMMRIKAKTILASAEISAVAALVKHTHATLEKIYDSMNESHSEMILRFKEMNAPKELIDKYMESMEELHEETIATLTKLTTTQLENK